MPPNEVPTARLVYRKRLTSGEQHGVSRSAERRPLGAEVALHDELLALAGDLYAERTWA